MKIMKSSACVLLLIALALPNIGAASQKSLVLNAYLKCPSPANLAALTAAAGMKDLADCVLACVLTDLCAGVHFSKASSRCYHGSSSELASLWDQSSVSNGSDGCVSYRTMSPISTIVPLAIPETTSGPDASMMTSAAEPKATTLSLETGVAGLSSALGSKLVILFDFRQGYTNLINPAMYSATPQGSVSRDTQGAHFPGSVSAFIDVDTAGNTLATSYLDYTHNFTFYARLVRQTFNEQGYHLFHDCSGNIRGEFSDKTTQLYVSHPFSGPSSAKIVASQSSGPGLVSMNNVAQDVSVAAVYTASNFATFYFNGSANGGSAQFPGFQGLPQCLRLGSNSRAGGALKGRFICYAIAKAALGVAEIAELNRFCGY